MNQVMNTSTTRKLAVVTGASSGIGYELAKQFAMHNFDLIIAAENDEIQGAAAQLRAFGVDVDPVQVNLATIEGNEKFYNFIQTHGHPVEALALNAGVGVHGDFVRGTALSEHLNLIHLNILSPVILAHKIAKDMTDVGYGRILFTSSIASQMPGTFMATYNASKAFIESFSEAIRNELKESGVTVTSLLPGATETEFFERAGMTDTKVGAGEKDDPAEVAEEGFNALMEGKDHVVAGSFKNTIQVAAAKVLPDTVKAAFHRKQAEPGSGHKKH